MLSPTMATCFSCGPRLPPGFPQLWNSAPQPMAHHSLATQAVSTQPTLVFSLELTSRAWISAPNPCLNISGHGFWGSGADDLCCSHSALPFSIQLMCFSWRLGSPSVSADLLINKVLPRVWVPFLVHSSLSGVLVPSWLLFSLSLFFLLFYPVMWRVSCPFSRFKFFCQCLVAFCEMLCVNHSACRCFFLMCL